MPHYCLNIKYYYFSFHSVILQFNSENICTFARAKGETYAYIDPGNYYIDLSVANCEYTVTVEAIIL